MPRTFQVRGICLLLIALAFLLRVYALGRQDLWGDEAVSALVLSHNATAILNGQVDPFHPPLYFLVLHLWTQLAGRTEFAIRYLSVLGMMVGVACIGRAGYEAQGRKTAALALILAAISPFLIYYAQEARMYGVAMALNAGALWAAMAALRRVERQGFWQVWIAFAALALGTLYAHYLSVLHLLGIAITLLIAWRARPRLLLTAASTAMIMGLMYLPWAWIQMNRTRGEFPYRPEVWATSELWRVMRDTLQAFSVGQTLDASWGWLVVGLMTAVAVAGWIWAIRSRRAERWMPGIIMAAVLIVGWAFGAFLFAFEPRYLMMGVPAYLLLVAMGLYGIDRRWPAAAALILAVTILAAGIANHTYYTSYSKGNYGKLMRTIAARARPHDIILLNNPLQRAIFEYYQPVGIDYYYLQREEVLDVRRLDAELTRLTEGREQVWLVMFGNPAEYDPQFRAENWLATHGAKSYYQGFGDATLTMYVMSTATAGATIPLSVTFGNQIALTAYRLSATEVTAGDTLIVELDWQAIAPPQHDYTIFVQLLDSDGTLAAQVDTPPLGGTRPTGQWRVGETISDRYALIVPARVQAGAGALIVGLYPWPDLTRLRVTEAGGLPVEHDAVRLATITLR